MEIICKCGHEYGHHDTDFLGCDVKIDEVGNLCLCRMSEAEVLLIHIAEQQARLDTNRAQVQALSVERKAMKQTFSEIFNLCEETDDMEEALYNISLLCSRHVE